MGNHSLRLSEVLSFKLQLKKFPTQADIGYYLAVFELISFICTFNENLLLTNVSNTSDCCINHTVQSGGSVKKARLHASLIHSNSTLLKLLIKATILVIQMLSN